VSEGIVEEDRSTEVADDPYTIQAGLTREPPTTLLGRLRNLGPGIVVTGSIVGSGEILLTSGLGAAAGFVVLWWVLFSCWIKSLVQAEIARYVVTSGDTYLRALNRVPGKIRGPHGPVAWPVWLGLVGFVPGILGSGGIIGGAGQALGLLLPEVSGAWATVIAAGAVMLILGSGSYSRFEKVMLVMVISFTFATVVSALLMQTTEFRATGEDILSGLQFDFPLEHAVLALAMYGATGVAAGEISAYTYWCVEKGYPSFVGGDHDDPGWVPRAKGWIRVIQTDVWVTLVILTCATLSFFFLGAGVLHGLDEQPSGTETINVLSNMYTLTLGPWSFWLFTVGAFCILFSTVLSGIGGGSRSFPDLLVTLGFIDRQNLALRKKWIRGYIIAMPIVSTLIYLSYQQPIALIIFGATFGAFMLPVQTFITLYLQANRMDQRVRPPRWITWAIIAIFSIQACLSVFIVRNILFA
jgi:Mn2+/Fe2+ NRAMP family transporter